MTSTHHVGLSKDIGAKGIGDDAGSTCGFASLSDSRPGFDRDSRAISGVCYGNLRDSVGWPPGIKHHRLGKNLIKIMG